MALGLAPVLAQILTVGVGDRAEVRLVADQQDIRYEAEDAASITAGLHSRNSDLRMEYASKLVVTPLESPSRSFNVFHHAGAGVSLTRRTRRSTLIASQNATFDQSNTSIEALSSVGTRVPGAQPPGGAQPPVGGPMDPMAPSAPAPTDAEPILSRETITTGTLRTELSNVAYLSRTTTLSGSLGYAFYSGLGESRHRFPLIQGPDAGLIYSVRVSRRDELATLLSSRYALSATGDRVFLAGAAETWLHRFSRSLSLNIGVGATYVYTDPHDGPPTEAILWGGAGAGLNFYYQSRLAGGRLTVEAGVGYAPTVDQSSFEVDARMSVRSGVSWTKRRLTLFASGSGVLSAEPDDPGALNSVGAGLGAIYDLGAGFTFETGARGAWQSFENAEIVPPTGALFVALAWSANVLGKR